MNAALLLLALVQQDIPISATAAVDRPRVAVGDQVLFTVTAMVGPGGGATLVAPSFRGFEVAGRSERRDVGSDGSRVQTWEFQLRAREIGTFTLGPVQVVRGGLVAQAAAIDVEVLAEGIGLAAQLSPRLRTMLERAVAPPDTGPHVTVQLSDTDVVVGQQVDVVTTAWFPRDLRLRLRRQPTLSPPAFSGVWNYPQPVPPGIVATRQVNGIWYDQFAYHQAIFPITAGTLAGEAAVLHYSVPLAFQFFSQEDRYELNGRVPPITVRPFPEAGRPAGHDGAVGSGILLTREVDGTPRVGEPVGVRFILSGRGNVALWPAPFLRWPTPYQVYPEGTDEKLDSKVGILGGTKTFRYLVVPDSTGVLSIPSVTYHYYDPESARYETAEVAGVRIPVAPATSAVTSRAEPPPLMHGEEPPIAWRVAHRLPRWAWVAVWLVPAALFGLARAPRRRRAAAAAASTLPPWLEAQHRLDHAIAVLGGEGMGGKVELTRALRAAGADGTLATRAAAVRDRLGGERFAATGGQVPPALLQEARSVAERLEALAHRGRRPAARSAGLVLLFLLAAPLVAQQVPAERLYETRAYRAALEAYRTRASATPAVPALWYGVGASAYRLGGDGAAVAAWIRAARLTPRDRALSRAMLLLPAPDPATAEWRAVPPITAEEWFLGATLLWFAAWGGVLVSGRWRGRWAVVAVGAVLAFGAAWYTSALDREPLGIVTATSPLRVSPHGRAPGSRDLPVGTAVRPTARRPGWALVRAATGEVGWMPTESVAWVRE